MNEEEGKKMMADNIKRREFIGGLAAMSVAAKVPGARGESSNGEMPYRTLGKTGVKVSAIGLDGFHLGLSHLEELDAIKSFHAAIDRGINFSANSWDYNQGISEKRVGKALKNGYRDKVFVMTKFDGRTKDSALKQLDESLQRLEVDHVDLWQFHENIRLEDGHLVYEVNGRREHLEGQSSDASRVPAICIELANLGGITGVDSMAILDQAFEAAKTYSSLSKADIEGILKKTVTVAANGKYEPFKTTPIFDSTAAHPEWLEYAAQA